MSRTEDPNANWTTWEELLLAFAVNRHGTNSWESIAIEIQNRTSSSLLFTANNCKQKYHELQRRFTAADEKTNGLDEDSDNNLDDKIPWLDELRKLRVAELRREVQRYDVSIVSLQSKVKKLKEDREQSSKETDNDGGKPDLKKEGAENDRDAAKLDFEVEEKRSKPVSGNDSDRENHSFNESNSTDSKDRNPEIQIGTDEEKHRNTEERFPKPEQEEAADADADAEAPRKPDPDVPRGDSPAAEAAGEGSYNGSSDTIARGAAVSSAVKSPAPKVGESAELHESVAESKGGEEGMKENSDVQSSASLSRRKRRKKAVAGGSSGDEPEPDEVSPVSKWISVKSHPLVGFLEIIRSHKHGYVFERRLESQETARYYSLIRQHLDLEMVRTKLEEGIYSDRNPEFFRDLLLLFNNAIVFFPRNSTESGAAANLRDIVSKEVGRLFPKPSPSSKEPPPPSLALPKSAPEPSNSTPAKPNSSAPATTLGKRSSAKAQPIAQTIADEKHEAAEPKEPERSPANLGAVEARFTKKRTRERSSSVARGTRTNNNRSNSNNNNSIGTRVSNPIPNPSSNSNSTVKAVATNENSEAKLEKKSAANSAVVAKKRSAANFLNRMKRSLSTSSTTMERTLLDSLKSSINNSAMSVGGGGSEQKKKGGRGGDGRRDSSLRQGSGKQLEEQKSPAGKRSVGRPPKRAAPPVQTSSRRAKETVDTEAKHPPPRKRARR